MSIHIPKVDFSSRDLKTLSPQYKKKAEAFLSGCSSLGVPILIYCTYRSPYTQSLLYCRGRGETSIARKVSSLKASGFLNLAELLESTPRTSGRTVTYAGPGESPHQHGLAFDFVPTIGGKPVWSEATDEELLLWQKAESVALQLGLRQLTFERPHLEDESFKENRIELMRQLYLDGHSLEELPQ